MTLPSHLNRNGPLPLNQANNVSQHSSIRLKVTFGAAGRASRLLLCVAHLGALLVEFCLPANAEESNRVTVAHIRVQGRPSNLYETIVSNSAGRCSSVLAELNRPYKLSPQQAHSSSNPLVDVLVWTKSDDQVLKRFHKNLHDPTEHGPFSVFTTKSSATGGVTFIARRLQRGIVVYDDLFAKFGSVSLDELRATDSFFNLISDYRSHGFVRFGPGSTLREARELDRVRFVGARTDKEIAEALFGEFHVRPASVANDDFLKIVPVWSLGRIHSNANSPRPLQVFLLSFATTREIRLECRFRTRISIF